MASHVQKNAIGFTAAYSNAHWFRAPSRLVVTHKRRDAAVMVVILSGRCEITWSGPQGASSTLKAGPGDVLLWREYAERVEVNDPADPQVAICVYFRIDRWPGGLPPRVHDHASLIRGLADSLLLLKDGQAAEPGPLQDAYVTAMLAEYIRLARHQAHPLVERVVRFTQANLGRAFSVRELAAEAGLHPHHFQRRYKALTGRTPMDDVRRMRIIHARGAIRSIPRLSLKDVAARCGIRSASHLARLLKRYLGVTARDLRS